MNSLYALDGIKKILKTNWIDISLLAFSGLDLDTLSLIPFDGGVNESTSKSLLNESELFSFQGNHRNF